ncbi:pleckstrin homology domain-containing family A member 4 [Echinops telfairi]|uniref:Pleckstrin homology domain-containing family A member 4 n=1 Tax=Echinops telfairi TaxID=9371 RepID=A0AC55DA08_ECHTE|nr:pleckstrin homology domain-containing family A member 4 [Echinops telfairi]
MPPVVETQRWSLMEEGRPRSSLSVASSVSTIASLNNLSAKKSTRAVSKVHAFGKRGNALRRDPNLTVHIRGWLHKQDSAGLRLWKRRWFVLSGHCLFYYKDSREESVLGSVLLPSYSIKPDGPGAPRGRRFTFTAEHPGMRTYVLAADTLEDLRGWLRALGRASRAEGDDCGQPRSPARPQPGEGPGGPGGPPEASRGEEGRSPESLEVARLSRARDGPRMLTPSSTSDLGRRARSPDLFTPLSRPPSPLILPRPRSAPARRPPPSSGDSAPPARPHTPMNRIDVRPPLEWGTQRRTLSRPPTPRRGPSFEAGSGRAPKSPQHRSQESRTQVNREAPSGSATYLQLPPKSPGTRASMVLLPGPPLDSTFHQSLETDTLLTKLCGQDRLLKRLQEELDQRQEEKEQLEAALELTRQQLSQTTREAGAPGRAWGRQRLLQDRLVCVRAALCHLAQERERVWDSYSGLEQELGTLRETLEYLLHLGSPQDRASVQQQLWMMEDTLAGLGGPQKPPPNPESGSPSSVLPGEESSERECVWVLGDPFGTSWGNKALGKESHGWPMAGAPQCSSLQAPQPRPRMSAQEQLERMRRHQEWARPLPSSSSLRLLPLGRTLPPARRQPDAEPRVRSRGWRRGPQIFPSPDSLSSSPRNTTPYLPTSDGHRERVLSLSQALATEASQWQRMMTGGNSDARGEPLPPAPPSPPDPTPRAVSPPRSPAVNSHVVASSSLSSGRGRGSAPWESTWEPGTAPPALTPAEGAWPLRVTLLQSSF